jgi:DNA invertase Pin-like site-specific DNA recombinase
VIPSYALYRRSRSHQDLSIEEQRQAVRTWAAEHGYQIIREFADDGSGLDTTWRREFQQLLDLCSSAGRRAADIVLCYDVSRFSRLEPDEAAFHEYRLRRAGIRVVYTHEPGVNEDGLTSQLVKTLKRAMAHDYSQKLSQVVQRGLRAHAERGTWTGGRPPYGYRRAVRQPDGTSRVLEQGRWKARSEQVTLVPDPFEASVVREHVYEPYVHGCGLAAIAHGLNERSVPTPTSDRRRGVRAWTKTTVAAILRNPVYRGRLVYAKARYSEIGKKRGKRPRPPTDWVVVEDAIPVIVPAPLWEAAQAKHGTRRFGVGRPWHRPYLLSGLIVCAHCGKGFRAHKQVRGRIPAYYVCGGYVESGRSVCDGLRVPITYLDDAVVDGIRKRLEHVVDREALRQRVRSLLLTDVPADSLVPALEAELASTDRKITRLVDALAGGPDDLRSVRRALGDLERERSRIERELRQARSTTTLDSAGMEAIADELVEALGSWGEILDSGQPEERKAVVRAFVQGISIDKAARQAILRWYRLPQVNRSLMMVELRGFEPLTPRLPALCSPN